MKETELQELERALQAATPAPWQTFPVEYVEGKPTGAVDLVGAADRVVIAPNLDKDDAALSAALRNAAPSLVGEVRSARKWKAALDALVDRLDFVHASDPYKCVWTLAHIRFGPYKGPNYIAELEAARALLGNADASPPPDSSAALREARRLLGEARGLFRVKKKGGSILYDWVTLDGDPERLRKTLDRLDAFLGEQNGKD